MELKHEVGYWETYEERGLNELSMFGLIGSKDVIVKIEINFVEAAYSFAFLRGLISRIGERKKNEFG